MDPQTRPSTSTRASRTRWITSRTLPGQRTGARRLFGAGEVERMAMLAAVDLGVGSEFFLHFIAEEKPTLQVAGAELALLVLLVTGAHARNAALHLGSIAERV